MFAFVFPGQGSQSVAMMNAYGDSAEIRAVFTEASEALGEDLWQMAQDGPAERLALTVNTQPLMLTADIAVYRAWLAAGGALPSVVAGHSLGEYAALVAAGALELADAVGLVRYRAEVMQQAVPEGQGAMAAIMGLPADKVSAVCAEAAQGQVVAAANLNAPDQTVIAGECDAVRRAMELSRAQGGKRAILLPVSAPFHCALMRPAAEKLRHKLETVKILAPKINVLNNADVTVNSDPQAIRDALVRQAYSPVRWVESVLAMHAAGCEALIECGPGKVLTGMNKRICKEVHCDALSDEASLQRLVTGL